jgi:uncharacterized membrane protein
VTPAEAVLPAPRWRSITALVLSLAGLGVSIYLTIAHFEGSQILVCAENSVVNCEKVTTSAQSEFLGIPVAILGLVFYVVMVLFNLPAAWRSQDRRVHIARLALAAIGMAFALWLIAAELVIIGAICLYCTSVHVITFLDLVVIVATVPTMLGWGGSRTAEADGWDDDDWNDEVSDDEVSDDAEGPDAANG